MASNCHGHSRRGELNTWIDKAKTRKAVPIKTSDLVIKRATGNATISLQQMADEFRASPEWKKMDSGQVYGIPVTNFRFKNLPLPSQGTIDYSALFRKKTRTDIGAFSMDETDNRLENEFKAKYKKMLQEGISEIDAQANIKKMKEYGAYQGWLDEKAEIELADKIQEIMNGLGIPCFVVRSLKQEGFANENEKPRLKNCTAYRNLGLTKILDGATEVDILVAFVWGDMLRIGLIEVKRPSSPPWQHGAGVPNKQNWAKCLSQLGKDLKLVDALLEDIGGENILFTSYSGFPTCSVHDLQTIFCPTCLQGIIVKDDLDNPTSLKEKLQVENPIPATDKGKHLLLTLVSRLAGSASRLHLSYRELTDKSKREEARHKSNIQIVDDKILLEEYVILSMSQQEILNNVDNTPNITIRGRAGSGKTLLCVALASAMAKKDDNSVLIMSTGWAGMSTSDPTMCHISDQIKKKDTGKTKSVGIIHSIKKMFGFQYNSSEVMKNENIIKSMPEVMKHVGLDYDSFKTSSGTYNYPSLITALSQAAADKYKNRTIILAVDECNARCAPKTTVAGDRYQDWTGLDNIGTNIRLCIAFNPQSAYPILLPTGQSFSHVEAEIRYRSTKSITKLVDMMAKHTLSDACVQTKDEIASDVDGQLPWVMDIGLANINLIESALVKIRDYMAGQANNTTVTMLYDSGFTVEMRDKLKVLAGQFGWPVYDVDQFAGWEDDNIVYVGRGQMEAFSRARLALYVVLGYEQEKYKKSYERF